MAEIPTGPVELRQWCMGQPAARLLGLVRVAPIPEDLRRKAWLELVAMRKRPSGGKGGDRRKGRKVPEAQAAADVQPVAGEKEDRG